MSRQPSTPFFDDGEDLSRDPRDWNICVVLPTRNEAATLERVAREIRAAFQGNSMKQPELFIADDSHDATRSIARRLGIHVVVGGGKGLGVAMVHGLKASLAFEPDVIVSADADGQSDFSELMNFLHPIAAGEADLVIGSRFRDRRSIRYHYKPVNRFGMFILSRILQWITGLPLTDSHGGLRAMRAEVVRHLDIIGTHTYVQETIIDAHEKGFRIKEIPSMWHPRTSGRSRVVGSVTKYVMYTLPILIIRAGGHVRWSYTASLTLMVAALGYFISVVWQAHADLTRMFNRLPALVFISMMIMASIQLFMLGFLTEVLGGIKLRMDRISFDNLAKEEWVVEKETDESTARPV